ncbi:MAG: hypothetical protein EOM87_09185, partial [Clostridia bacterium]|nr:hypothetical protein [Clostridia bacterium]
STAEPLISIKNEGGYEAVKLGSNKIPLKLQHSMLDIAETEVSKNPKIIIKDTNGNNTEDNLALLSDIEELRSDIEDALEDAGPENEITLVGTLCKRAVFRTTPFMREIADMLIAVNRAYGRSDYIPCIAWGRNARYVNTLNVGDRISLCGRIQSRDYQKLDANGEYVTKTAFEVSICRISTGREENAEEECAEEELIIKEAY